MISRINRLLVIVAVAAAVAYLITANPQDATLMVWRSQVYHASMGVMTLAIFGAGFLLATIGGMFFGIRSYLRERSLRNKLHQRDAGIDLLIRARNLIASREHARARHLLSSIVRRDRGNILARLELADCLSEEGDAAGALAVLDEARQATADPPLEVIVRASQLNRQLGNRTAALDLITQAVERGASRALLELARNCAREADDIDGAIRFHREWIDIGGAEDAPDLLMGELEFARLRRDWNRREAATSESASFDSWRDTVRAFLKRFPGSIPALIEAARVEISQGEVASAVQHLTRAAEVSQNPHFSRWAVELWLTHGQPERALATARASAHDAKGTVAYPRAQLDLVRTLLALAHTEEADRILTEIEAAGSSEPLTPELLIRSSLLRASLMLHRRQIVEAQRNLDQLLESEVLRRMSGESSFSNTEGNPLVDERTRAALHPTEPQRALPSPDGVAPALSTP